MAESGKLVKNKQGRFVKGVSGNPAGRPVGSKNVITTQKLLLEEVFRSETQEDVLLVLKMVVAQALDGDKTSQKLIWDSAVSKMNITDDKATGTKQNITVNTMNVTREGIIEGEFVDVPQSEDISTKETIQ